MILSATAGLTVTAVLGLAAFVGAGHALSAERLHGQLTDHRASIALRYFGQTTILAVVLTLCLYGAARLVTRPVWPAGRKYVALATVTCGFFVWLAGAIGSALYALAE